MEEGGGSTGGGSDGGVCGRLLPRGGVSLGGRAADNEPNPNPVRLEGAVMRGESSPSSWPGIGGAGRGDSLTRDSDSPDLSSGEKVRVRRADERGAESAGLCGVVEGVLSVRPAVLVLPVLSEAGGGIACRARVRLLKSALVCAVICS